MIFSRRKKTRLLSLQCFHCGKFFQVGIEHQRVDNYCNDCKD